jgi:SAM-dependent methyltransferase
MYFMTSVAIQRPNAIKSPTSESFRQNAKGIYVVPQMVRHRDEEYDASHFDMLLEMQRDHFWYRGRHRFLLHAVRKHCGKISSTSGAGSAIDMGGGCGGWLQYLQQRAPSLFDRLAIGDSSVHALELAGSVVGPDVDRYQIDLAQLPWQNRWDVAFLLDVLEHIPDDVDVLREITHTLRPGGRLFVTTPALDFFWSYNDELVHHVRRYTRRDFSRLAAESGLVLHQTRYFMTFLSPLLLLSRLKSPVIADMSREQIVEHQCRTHRVPPAPINNLLSFIFSLETPLGHWCPMPWGTSVLAVFRKPD